MNVEPLNINLNRETKVIVNPLLLGKVVFPAYHGLRNTKVLKRLAELEKNQWYGSLLQLKWCVKRTLHYWGEMPNYRRADIKGGTSFFTVVTYRRQQI